MNTNSSDEPGTTPFGRPHTYPAADPIDDQSRWHNHTFTPDASVGTAPSHTAPQHPVHPAAPRRSVLPIVAVAALAGLIGGAVGVGGYALIDHRTSTPVIASAPAVATDTAKLSPGSVTYAARVASRSTADIKVSTSQGTAVGSGIILTPDGYILTNNHVVTGAGTGAAIQVTTPDGNTYPATIQGTSPSYDLAVVKLRGASGLTPATIGDSSTLQVGQQVVAVGSPENLSNTVTSGIVSALSRTVTAGDEQGNAVSVYNGLQTDTAINPGNSGGPLVNLAGQVIGVNSAVDTGDASNGGVQAFGLGFAIPSNTAKRITEELLRDGHATKPVLGVSGSLDSSAASVTGAPVSAVTSGGAAAKAGIRSGDVITKVAGTPISNYADLMAQILTHVPGQTVPVTLTRNGQSRTVQVTLGSTVDKEQTTVPEQQREDTGRNQWPFGGDGSGLIP
ncbi:MAG: trypsin-like peptidase domain-containing protein [Gordonia sp. (in: high G+C Gram-positive bacteria)]